MKEFILGDCMDYLPEFEDNHFDLAIVDPQYGIDEGNSAFKSRNTPIIQKNGNVLHAPDVKYVKGDWDKAPPSMEYFMELRRISKQQIIFGINYFNLNWGPGRIVWDKCNGDNDFSDCEIAYCSMHNSTRLFRYMWAGMMQGKSVTEGHIMQGNKSLNEKRIHPTQKPVIVYKWLLRKYAKPEFKIIDTHVGSGSSLVAFEDFECEYWACEKNEKHYSDAVKRLDIHKSQLRLL